MYKTHDFNNGLKLIHIPFNSNIISCGMFINAGSIYENNDFLGISHFIEHLLFKKNYNLNKLDNLGIEYNAVTSFEYTYYEFNGLSKYIYEIIKILIDMIFEPKFTDIDREKIIVIQELLLRQNDTEILYKKLLKNTKFNKPIGGTIKTIEDFTKNDVINYYNYYYQPNNMVLCIVGNCDINKIKPMINTIKSNNKYTNYSKPIVSLHQTNPYLYIEDSNNLSHIFITFKTHLINKSNKYTVNLIGTLLSSGLDSLLYNELRYKLDSTYSPTCDIDLFDNFGLFTINIHTNKENVNKIIKHTLKILTKLKNGIDNKILNKIKLQKYTTLQLNNYNTNDILIHYGLQFLTNNDIIDYDKINEMYNKVSLNDINKLMNNLFQNKYLNIVLLGKTTSQKQLVDIISFF